ncbi:MAG: ABC transporter ATP-binding protein [Candidatus Rokubacteria bacterium]|nr:ABC transporter ATP-binding protein [Candidatus Rokubacteria bacterium]
MGEIVAEDLQKTFVTPEGVEVVALDGINLKVRTCEFLCVLGPSGCGKTTFMNIVSGLERPTAGRVLVDGRPVEGPRQEVAVVFQEYNLFPWKTAAHNVEFGLKARGQSKAKRRDAALRYLEIAGLKGFEDRYPHQLSGGMKQRVGIARALAVDPEILLMDEPFGALDAQSRTFFQEELLRIYDRVKKTVVFITHNINEAIFLGDRVAVMTFRPGRIKEVVGVDLPRPRTLDVLETAEFASKRSAVWRLLREESRKAFEAKQEALVFGE